MDKPISKDVLRSKAGRAGIALNKINGLIVGLTEQNIPTTKTSVKLGSMSFDSVPTGLHQKPIFSGESGLVGNGLLARFERVTFDTKAGRLVLDGRRAGF